MVAAVVRIPGGDVVVHRRVSYGARANPRRRGPERHELPFGLRIDVRAAHGVVLVAAQIAEIAEVVDEALAPLVLPIGICADRDDERAAERGRGPDDARADAAIVAVEIRDATRTRRTVRRRDRQVLADSPLTAIRVNVKLQRVAEPMVERGPDLLLIDRLARIEPQRRRVDTARIRLPRRARQAQRILGFGLILSVADERQARRRREVEDELRVGEVAPCRGVVAIAVGGELARRHHGAEVPGAPGDQRAERTGTVTAPASGYGRA